MKKKIVTILFILLIIGLVVFLANTTRKIIIIKDLQNKVSECEKKENIYTKVDGESAIAEKFIKDGVEKDVIKKRDNTVTMIQVIKEHERRMYVIAGEQKTLTISKEEKNDLAPTKVVSFVDTVTWKELLHDSIVSKIYTEKVDGYECYVIDSMKNTNATYSEGTISLKMYLNKETGLAVKVIETIKDENGSMKENVTTYNQKFDIITDEDMIEPNIQEFTIQEN
ncbi:MAG: hypothetical protein HFJ33_01580 [Clostridia bacterium]|nr:hypothetical protein [Clostridia bacterium]